MISSSWKYGIGIPAAGVCRFLSSDPVYLEKFIYRKIKLIYKFIHQTKATRKEEVYFKYILPKKSIDEVREDVERWGNKQTEEIELLRKNEAFRKEFLQNLSHEFKTPIFAIQGYVDTLLNGAMDDLKVRKRFLENTERNVERLVNLVNDLDEISKLERGEQLLLKQNFVIQDLIREVFESLSINMQDKNMRTGIKKGCEYPITCFCRQRKNQDGTAESGGECIQIRKTKWQHYGQRL